MANSVVISEVHKTIEGSTQVTGVTILVDGLATSFVDLDDITLTGVKATDEQTAINTIVEAAATFRLNGYNFYSLDDHVGQDIINLATS